MKRILKSVAVLSILSMAGAVPVLAQQTPPMPGMTIPMKPGATAAEGSMMSAMDKMSKDMAAIPITGDADRDFVGMMIPHHQGAIDMANFELAHGKDPAIRKLARAIIAAQNKEIAGMKAWQAKHPGAR
jgi:uncharacterized protein (DUF305 family)